MRKEIYLKLKRIVISFAEEGTYKELILKIYLENAQQYEVS